MKSKKIRVLCVGKIKTPWWRDAAERYLDLLQKWRACACEEVKDAEAELPPQKRLSLEADRLKARLNEKDLPIYLNEGGKLFNSRQFARFLHNLDEREQRTPTFIVGGPYGLADEFKNAPYKSISLSPMTFPHELARVILLEQLFRAESILRNFPYHN